LIESSQVFVLARVPFARASALSLYADQEGGYGTHVVDADQLVLGHPRRGLVQEFVKILNPRGRVSSPARTR
jgi:hypothetical protein